MRRRRDKRFRNLPINDDETQGIELKPKPERTPEENEKLSKAVVLFHRAVNEMVSKSKSIPKAIKDMRKIGYSTTLNIEFDLGFEKTPKKLRKNFKLKLNEIDKAFFKEFGISRK